LPIQRVLLLLNTLNGQTQKLIYIQFGSGRALRFSGRIPCK
jgi:hypothetical protein